MSTAGAVSSPLMGLLINDNQLAQEIFRSAALALPLLDNQQEDGFIN
ncbi:MAG: hypothetical protein ACXAEU_01795 [Candidatus Hodarchaeales archaeon]